MFGPLILIADDNEPTRNLMCGILEAENFKTVQAIDGGSALKVIQEQPVACAIVDQYMEPMGGFELAKRLRDEEMKAPPLVMMTAHETSDLLTQAHELGFAQILTKPVAPLRLVKTVQRLLR